jgi:hypothetical protein
MADIFHGYIETEFCEIFHVCAWHRGIEEGPTPLFLSYENEARQFCLALLIDPGREHGQQLANPLQWLGAVNDTDCRQYLPRMNGGRVSQRDPAVSIWFDRAGFNIGRLLKRKSPSASVSAKVWPV